MPGYEARQWWGMFTQMAPEAFAAIVKSDIAKWRKIVVDLNIKVD